MQDLIEIEAQFIRKMKTVTMPNRDKLLANATAKVKKNIHIVFLFSDLMSYKETFQLFPQFEYLCEVMFMDDITQQGYLYMADQYLNRSNIASELIGED